MHGLLSTHLLRTAGESMPRAQQFGRDQAVIFRGAGGAELYEVIQGWLRVVGECPDGRRVSHDVMGAGEVFGEMALLGGRPRVATVEAIGTAHVRRFSQGWSERALASDPALRLQLMELVVRRARDANSRYEDRVFFDVPTRLARRLVDLASRFGRGEPVTLPRLTHAALAELVGATRESVSKHMAQWVRDGTLEVTRTALVVRAPEHLRACAEL